MPSIFSRLIKRIASKDQFFWILASIFILVSIPFTVYSASTFRDLRSKAAQIDSPCYYISSTGVYKAIDLDGDDQITINDVNALQAHYLSTTTPQYDLNSSGKVDVADLLIVENKVGTTCFPTISYYYSSSSSINAGQSVKLYWKTQFAKSVSVNGVAVDATSNQADGTYYYPTATTTYTILATNPLGTNSTKLTVSVSASVPSPTIDLKVNGSNGPISVNYNTGATLSWTSTNAASCTASGGWSGSKATSSTGYSTGNLTGAQTYTLTCANSAGITAKDSVSVSVATVSSPPTLTFTASPTSITVGQGSTLSWTSSNATSISIDNGVGTVCTTSSSCASGSKLVTPSANTTYTATAAGSGGTIQALATITVSTSISGSGTPKPAVTLTTNLLKSAVTNSVQAGGNFSLLWTSSGATKVVITATDGVDKSSLGTVCSTASTCTSGTRILTPTKTTNFSAVAYAADGTASAAATTSITVTCTGIPVLSLSPTFVTPIDSLTATLSGLSNCASGDRIGIWILDKKVTDYLGTPYWLGEIAACYGRDFVGGLCRKSFGSPSKGNQGYYALAKTATGVTAPGLTGFVPFFVVDNCAGQPTITFSADQPAPGDTVTATGVGLSNCGSWDYLSFWIYAPDNNGNWSWQPKGNCNIHPAGGCSVSFKTPAREDTYQIQAFIIKSDQSIVLPAGQTSLRVVWPIQLAVYNSSNTGPDYIKTYIKTKTAGQVLHGGVLTGFNHGAAVWTDGASVDYGRMLWGLAGCESNWTPTAVGHDPTYGDHYGLFQYAPGTWPSSAGDILNPYNQVDFTISYINAGNLGAWQCEVPNNSGRYWFQFIYSY